MCERQQTFSFLSLNVRGLRDKLKRSKIFSWINHQKSDVILLQETFLTSEIETVIKQELNYHCFFNHGTNHARGVATLIKMNQSTEYLEHNLFCNGRVLAVRVKYGTYVYLILNVYAPTKRHEKERFFQDLFKWLKKVKHKEDTLVLGGDWNCVQNAQLDTHGMSYTYKRVKWFEKLQKHFSLIDVWRKMFPLRKQYTWRQLSYDVCSRLDFWLLSDTLWTYVQTTEIKPMANCDHCAVTLKLITTETPRGCGIWKMNNSLLLDNEYKTKIVNVIRKIKLESINMNAQMKWDMCKIKIKEYTIKYAKQKNKEKQQTYQNLQDEYDKINRQTEENPSEANVKKVKEIRRKLDQLLTYKCKGAFIRSRQQWIEKGEKSTKYFLKSEKINAKKKEIDSIKKNGRCIMNQEKILQEIFNYYEVLYSKDTIDIDKTELNNYLGSIQLPVLTEEEALLCEGMLNEKECRDAIFSMKNNKSPGSDGLSVEFYKCFWNEIKYLVMDSLNYGYIHHELSESQKLSIITLLYKKGDKQCLDNWRPISLLNTDYKILTKVLCKRLKQVIDELISSDQTGYLKQRSAMQNLRLVQDIIEYCESCDFPGILLFLDFKKAFDSISHEFLFQLLDKLHFKESFVTWIKVIYNKAVGSVINKGRVSQKFEIKRGIRQGCPLSALLFILVAEVMALKIKQNNDIHGIIVHSNKSNMSKEFKISQLADDTVIFLNGIESANTAIEEVKQFGIFAGPSLNFMKTNALSIQPQSEFVNGLNWSDEPIKYLGIYLTRNNIESERMNWFEKLSKVKSILNFWKLRNLTIYGKVLILKALIISQFVYTASVLPVPYKLIIDLNKLMYNFIWNSKREKVKRSVLLNPIQNGGLGMIDLHAKFKSVLLSWFTNFVNCDLDVSWRFMFEYWIEKICPIPLLLNSNCSSKDMLILCKKHKIPNFYVQCLIAWSEIKYIDFMCVTNVSKEILWYNSNIKFEGETLFFKEWYCNGLLSLGDILVNGRFKSRDFICNTLESNSLLVDFKYTKLKHAIPRVWVHRTRDHVSTRDNRIRDYDSDTYEIKTLDTINLSLMKSKQFYTILRDLKIVDVAVLAFWEERLNLGSEFNWKGRTY